ncbi:GGDEF domain-containing protein [Niveibacterium sp. 24ML]|uniref:GGDEF domain-containing protein n=1 Tax=Niveibacterium sp. 24ML TaxID=2985512 RepID=UPI0022721FFC|nr:GGDEF domain-containing protein [Niveibacterium sp. 24ML]MCX9156932.1 GGDEF domain-containing protein [Niveibacterium sp. 24ML]
MLHCSTRCFHPDQGFSARTPHSSCAKLAPDAAARIGAACTVFAAHYKDAPHNGGLPCGRRGLRAEHLAHIDPLTGLHNRLAFHEQADPIWRTALPTPAALRW